MDFSWPAVPVGHPPIQGENEPDWHFAQRLEFREKARSVRFGGSVLAAEMRSQGDQEARDMEAYKSLRQQGYQPKGINGADRLAATATSEADVDIHAARQRDADTLASRGLEFTS